MRHSKTYRLSVLAVQQILHGLEADDGVLDAMEEGALPGNSAPYRRLVLGDRRVVLVLLKQGVDRVHLWKK